MRQIIWIEKFYWTVPWLQGWDIISVSPSSTISGGIYDASHYEYDHDGD